MIKQKKQTGRGGNAFLLLTAAAAVAMSLVTAGSANASVTVTFVSDTTVGASAGDEFYIFALSGVTSVPALNSVFNFYQLPVTTQYTSEANPSAWSVLYQEDNEVEWYIKTAPADTTTVNGDFEFEGPANLSGAIEWQYSPGSPSSGTVEIGAVPESPHTGLLYCAMVGGIISVSGWRRFKSGSPVV